MCMCVYIYIYICVCVCIYIYIYIYIYTHTQARWGGIIYLSPPRHRLDIVKELGEIVTKEED